MDIFNPEGMSPYKDLVVASEWLNSQGTDIVRHIVDTAPNKFEISSGDGDDASKDSEGSEVKGEEEKEVVEDLISGLDDDGA